MSKTLSIPALQRARDFVKTRARPVDQAFLAFSFDEAPGSAVWETLSPFANSDGGFGHGMEPDCRLPASSTLATITAFTYLIPSGAPADHPLVAGGIRHLLQTYDSHLQGWPMLPPEADNHPRAFWWNHSPPPSDPAALIDSWSNPSAAVAAILHHYKEAGVPPALLEEVTAKAFAVLEAKRETLTGHDFLAFVELAEALPESLARPVWTILKNRARSAILTDPAQWNGYGIRPLWAVPAPGSPLFAELADSVNLHLDFEIDQQQPDGSWHPFWTWGRYEAEWETAKIEWQGHLTVKTLRALKAHGRIAPGSCPPN
jgi:hypothetical protein